MASFDDYPTHPTQLTDGEKELVSKVDARAQADFSLAAQKVPIRAQLVQALLTGSMAQVRGGAPPLMSLRGAILDGDVNLAGMIASRVVGPTTLILEDCEVHGYLVLTAARLSRLSLKNSC